MKRIIIRTPVIKREISRQPIEFNDDIWINISSFIKLTDISTLLNFLGICKKSILFVSDIIQRLITVLYCNISTHIIKTDIQQQIQDITLSEDLRELLIYTFKLSNNTGIVKYMYDTISVKSNCNAMRYSNILSALNLIRKEKRLKRDGLGTRAVKYSNIYKYSARYPYKIKPSHTLTNIFYFDEKLKKAIRIYKLKNVKTMQKIPKKASEFLEMGKNHIKNNYRNEEEKYIRLTAITNKKTTYERALIYKIMEKSIIIDNAEQGHTFNNIVIHDPIRGNNHIFSKEDHVLEFVRRCFMYNGSSKKATDYRILKNKKYININIIRDRFIDRHEQYDHIFTDKTNIKTEEEEHKGKQR